MEDEPTRSERALKKGGPAKMPTLPSSRVPRAKMMVMGRQRLERTSLRVMLRLSRGWRGWRVVGWEEARLRRRRGRTSGRRIVRGLLV